VMLDSAAATNLQHALAAPGSNGVRKPATRRSMSSDTEVDSALTGSSLPGASAGSLQRGSSFDILQDARPPMVTPSPMPSRTRSPKGFINTNNVWTADPLSDGSSSSSDSSSQGSTPGTTGIGNSKLEGKDIHSSRKMSKDSAASKILAFVGSRRQSISDAGRLKALQQSGTAVAPLKTRHKSCADISTSRGSLMRSHQSGVATPCSPPERSSPMPLSSTENVGEAFAGNMERSSLTGGVGLLSEKAAKQPVFLPATFKTEVAELAPAPPEDPPSLVTAVDMARHKLSMVSFMSNEEKVEPHDNHELQPQKRFSGGSASSVGTSDGCWALRNSSGSNTGSAGTPCFDVLRVWVSRNSHRQSYVGNMHRRSHHKISVQSMSQDLLPVLAEKLEMSGLVSEPTRYRRWKKQLLEKSLQPSSTFILSWKLCSLLLMAYDIFVAPMTAFDPPKTWLSIVITWVVRFFFVVDIPMNYCIGYLNTEGVVETRRVQVALRYTSSWFPLDLLCVILDWLALVYDDRSSFLPYVRILRVARVLRVFKAPEVDAFVTEHVRSEVTILAVSGAKYLLVLFFVVHLIACMWYSICHRLDDSWVVQHQLEQAGFWDRYALSYHWSLGQFVGSTHYELRHFSERVFAVGALFFALLFSTLFVSSVTTSMTHIQFITSQRCSQMTTLRRYLCDAKISQSLAVRVQRNAEHALQEAQRRAPENSIELLKIISEPVLVELHVEVYFPVLSKNLFFKCYNEVDPAGMGKVCHSAASLQSFSSGDEVFKDYETPVCPQMFFVTRGRLEYIMDGVPDPVPIKPGEWVCEAVLWTAWMHAGTLRAVTDCTLVALNAERFQKIVSAFPTDHARKYAENFVAALNWNVESGITDLHNDEINYAAMRAFPAEKSLNEGAVRRSMVTRGSSADSMHSMTSSCVEVLRELSVKGKGSLLTRAWQFISQKSPARSEATA